MLGWLSGVKLEEFLNSHTKGSFQHITINSRYPQPACFDNYVPTQFKEFMKKTIQEWEDIGVIQKWESFRQNSLEEKPVVVCPLSVEPDKPEPYGMEGI